MAKLLIWIQTVLVPWLGPPGVLVVAALDSSFLSLPEITDLLVITSGMKSAQSAWVAALMASLGSVVGCSALWWVGRRGGEGLLRKRFGDARVQSIRAAFHRWNMLALAVPAMSPPPVPFKAFVIAAGVFHVPYRRFAATIFIARAVRYAIWVVVSLLYHERALAFLSAIDHWFVGRGRVTLLVAAALVLLMTVIALRRRAAAPAAADDAAL